MTKYVEITPTPRADLSPREYDTQAAAREVLDKLKEMGYSDISIYSEFGYHRETDENDHECFRIVLDDPVFGHLLLADIHKVTWLKATNE